MARTGLYLPDFVVICRLLGKGLSLNDISDTDKVTLPFGILRALLRGALTSAPFSEDRYLSSNPDVAGAVLRGEIGSGREHAMSYGYFEGRDGLGEELAELWYLRRNPDVANAVRDGVWPSGRHHYEAAGRFELRSPNARAEEDMTSWRAYFTAPDESQVIEDAIPETEAIAREAAD